MIMFADDTKLYRRITTDEDDLILQSNLDIFQLWSQIWLIEFNKGKCKSLHYGYENPMIENTIYEEVLRRTVLP